MRSAGFSRHALFFRTAPPVEYLQDFPHLRLELLDGHDVATAPRVVTGSVEVDVTALARDVPMDAGEVVFLSDTRDSVGTAQVCVSLKSPDVGRVWHRMMSSIPPSWSLSPGDGVASRSNEGYASNVAQSSNNSEKHAPGASPKRSAHAASWYDYIRKYDNSCSSPKTPPSEPWPPFDASSTLALV